MYTGNGVKYEADIGELTAWKKARTRGVGFNQVAKLIVKLYPRFLSVDSPAQSLPPY